jgi:predicted flap endonuclease-1-like 5' DNA nuclease
MAYKIADVEGVGPAYAEKLKAAGIATTDDFLKICCDRKGRQKVCDTTGISDKLVLKWANHCDLMRVNGVGPEYSELLEAAGVDTVKELRNRRADNLATKMKEVCEEKKITRTSPSAKVVQKWIDQAKELDPVMTH